MPADLCPSVVTLANASVSGNSGSPVQPRCNNGLYRIGACLVAHSFDPQTSFQWSCGHSIRCSQKVLSFYCTWDFSRMSLSASSNFCKDCGKLAMPMPKRTLGHSNSNLSLTTMQMPYSDLKDTGSQQKL